MSVNDPMTMSAPTAATDSRLLFDRFTGLEKPGIQCTESHPLTRIQRLGQNGEFAQDLQSTDFADAGCS